MRTQACQRARSCFCRLVQCGPRFRDPQQGQQPLLLRQLAGAPSATMCRLVKALIEATLPNTRRRNSRPKPASKGGHIPGKKFGPHMCVSFGAPVHPCTSTKTMRRVPDSFAYSQRVGVLRSLLPASLFEHLSMSQACHPPTHWTTLCLQSVLSSPFQARSHRMCVIGKKLGCLLRAHTCSRTCHCESPPDRSAPLLSCGLFAAKLAMIHSDTVVLGACFNARLPLHWAQDRHGNKATGGWSVLRK